MKRLIRSRKGEEDDELSPWLVAAALGVISLLVLLLLYSKIFAGSKETPEETKCRASIAAHTKILSASAGDFATNIECEPRMTAISTDDEEKAKRALAEEMKFCWDRWQRGDLELFEKEGIYCNPCSFITLSGPATGISGFSTYLSTTPVKKGGPTYAQYLMSGQSVEAKGNVKYAAPDGVTDTLPANVEYATLFIYAKGESMQRIQENFGRNPVRNVKQIAWMTGIGAVVGGVTIIVATGGVAAIPIILAGTAGGVIGGVGEYLIGSAEQPEWISIVVLQPNDADALRGLGCQWSAQRKEPAIMEA